MRNHLFLYTPVVEIQLTWQPLVNSHDQLKGAFNKGIRRSRIRCAKLKLDEDK